MLSWSSCGTAILVLLLLSQKSFQQCLNDDDSAPSETAASANHVNKLEDGSSDFAFKLFKDLVAKINGETDNVLISPISVWAILLVASLGARGNTESELKSALHVEGVSKPELTNAYADFRDKLLHNETSTANYTFNLANKVFLNSNIPIRECIGNTNLNAELQSLDFGNNLEPSRLTINQWVESMTNNKIKELIQRGDVSALTLMVLVNAAYFRGIWQRKFDFEVGDSDFFVKPNQPVNVTMMTVTSSFRVGDDAALGCSALELPYSGRNVSMIILLPNNTVEELVPKLTTEKLNNLYNSLQPTTIKVNVPKFKYEQSTDLKEYVQRLGVNDIFVAGVANFSGFTGNKESHVSLIRQKAYIDVNKQGTEAAAATAIGIVTTSLVIPNRGPFICNKPFVYFIRNNDAKTILFGGIIRKPEYK